MTLATGPEGGPWSQPPEDAAVDKRHDALRRQMAFVGPLSWITGGVCLVSAGLVVFDADPTVAMPAVMTGAISWAVLTIWNRLLLRASRNLTRDYSKHLQDRHRSEKSRPA